MKTSPSAPLPHRRNLVTRVIRPGQRVPAPVVPDGSTPGSRMEQVWELTQMCLAMRKEPPGELRLQRSVVRIQRRGR